MTAKDSKVIIFAPHLCYPLRNGADMYIDRLACYLSLKRSAVLVLGTDTLTRYERGALSAQSYFLNTLRAKAWAALRTILFKSHYLVEKYLTTSYRQKAVELFQENPGALIVYSFILSASLELTTEPAIVVTHNDEIDWFRNQFLFSDNPLQRVTAKISEEWLRKFVGRRTKDFIFIHITENDYQSYQRLMPQHIGFVVPAGVEMQQLPEPHPLDDVIRLLFVGSLGVKMNYDALVFFKEKFWPVLQSEFPDKIELTVLGSSPSSRVRQLCRQEHWQLLPDASDEELHRQYGQADFAILPHSYTSGAKLKLLNSLAAGLPVLATTNMKILPGQEFFPNLYSDDPLVWRDHLRKIRTAGISLEQRALCQEFASQYNWEKIAVDMDEKLRQFGL